MPPLSTDLFQHRSHLDNSLQQQPPEPRGRVYWQQLEQIAAAPDFLERARRDFPAFAVAAETSCDRRRFLQLAAASMALMGIAACGPEVQPRDRRPYVQQPPGIVPGRSRYYATATSLQGYGTGVLIEHRMGRPIKVEGNPDHPASLGASSAIGQATLLSLYDPFRAQALTHNGQISTWEGLATGVADERSRVLRSNGQGLALLTGAVSGPTLVNQIALLRQQYPGLCWFQWEAVSRDQVRDGARQAFGRSVDMLPDFAAADVIVAVESDFLDSAPGHLRFARDFASRRRAAEVRQHMSRLYALESTPTLAGAKADHRLRLAPAEIEYALRYLAGAVGAGPQDWVISGYAHARPLDTIARELRSAQGRALVHVGPAQSAAAHAIAHLINSETGALGKAAVAIEPVLAEPQSERHSLADLTEAIWRKEIETLVILGGNPVFTSPADLEFERALRCVPFSVYLGEYADETAGAVHWHVPQAHEYETWSDVRAFDGTTALQQPQLITNDQRRSAHELLALFSGETTPDALTIVRELWQGRASDRGVKDFESFWTEALRSGVIPDSRSASVGVAIRSDVVQAIGAATGNNSSARGGNTSGLSVLFRPDDFLWDGRFADNGWLQELPRPFTRLTWDNAALVAPHTAERLGLASSDTIELRVGTRRAQAPVWVLPGQAEDCFTLPLGFGRRTSGPVGVGVGFNAYPLRSTDGLWQASGAAVRKLDTTHVFAPIQHEIRSHSREIVHEGTLSAFLRDSGFLQDEAPAESLYPPFQYPGIAWAMSINLSACIGCQACVAACQAENNSPVVGKTEVVRGREMHWLRVDRYYEGPLDAPRVVFQPVPCMHCENAPCEVVCPVHATVHDSEGLNVMVYNRCVGTRFCSNNCPYKVRRFNFFDYTAPDPRPRESWNPEVSVRGRGVMEKCTYCIQRTRAAMIEADKENRRVRDGEVLTACQQVCPTQAIVFGDRNDPRSRVAQRKQSPLDYCMLSELNTRPRTSYEALIRNPSPDLHDV